MLSDASRATIVRILRKTTFSPALIPGGFAEAVYTNAQPDLEFSYIKERSGFIKLAIEEKVDIIVTYSFGLNDMYHTLNWRRHERAKLAQTTSLPLLWWWGAAGPVFGSPICGNVPLTESVVVCTFDPFPTSQYTLDQVEQAHTDYMAYLKECFDSRKAEAGYGHKELYFIGKNTRPPLSRL